MVLAVQVMLISLGSGPPTGRWDGEVVGGAPSGHLGNPGHNVPLLGEAPGTAFGPTST